MFYRFWFKNGKPVKFHAVQCDNDEAAIQAAQQSSYVVQEIENKTGEIIWSRKEEANVSASPEPSD